VFFSFATIVDNLLYFLKGCILQNLIWGSYHTNSEDEEERRDFVVVPLDIPEPGQKP
jgi:hypothetical protein